MLLAWTALSLHLEMLCPGLVPTAKLFCAEQLVKWLSKLGYMCREFPNWLTMPRNHLRSDTDCGTAISRIALILSGSGFTPSLST